MLRPAAPLALVLLVGSTHVLSAQSTSASLTGRVTDPSKAMIAGAKIAGFNTGTGVEYDTASNANKLARIAWAVLSSGNDRHMREEQGLLLASPEVQCRRA